MATFAPVLRPGGLAVADGGESVEADDVVGVEVGKDEDEDEDEDDDVAGVVVGVEVGGDEDDDVVAVGTEAVHVVAGRSDLWWCLQVSGCFLYVVRCLASSRPVGRIRTAH